MLLAVHMVDGRTHDLPNAQLMLLCSPAAAARRAAAAAAVAAGGRAGAGARGPAAAPAHGGEVEQGKLENSRAKQVVRHLHSQPRHCAN